MRLITSFLMCFFLLWQSAVAQPLAQNRNSQLGQGQLPQSLTNQNVIVVSPQEFNQIKTQNPEAQEYQLNQREADQFFAQLAKEAPAANEDNEEKKSQEKLDYSGSDNATGGGSYNSSGVNLGVDAVRIGVHIGPRPPSFHFPKIGGGGRGGDDAVLFLLLIGAVIVVFMVVAYVFQFASYKIKDMTRSNKKTPLEKVEPPRYKQRFFAGADSFQFLSSETNVDTAQESGALKQIIYRLEDTKSSYNLGLQIEVGQIDGTFILEDKETTYSLKGGYGLVGPTAYVDFTPNFGLDFSILAGTTEHKTVGTVSLMRLALNIGGDKFFGQLSLGSLYVSLKGSEGLARYKNDFNALAGIKMGYSF
ncbi:MAG: hypothetical protein QNL04_05850 [SAR324 cluster bacterium]|nr:hypothetical protein [SAR324 cluster bacterium]